MPCVVVLNVACFTVHAGEHQFYGFAAGFVDMLTQSLEDEIKFANQEMVERHWHHEARHLHHGEGSR